MAKSDKKNAQKGTRPDEVTFNVEDFSGGIKGVIEAILITAPDLQYPKELAKMLAVKEADVKKALSEIADELTARKAGYELREIDGGFRYYSAAEYGEVVAHYVVGGAQTRFSPAALETLAIIAYRQPATRSQIAGVRGVNVDGVIRTLLQRGYITEAEETKGTGELGARYITTPLFLEKLGISSLAELEPLAPFLPDDFEDIPQFEDPRKTTRNKSTDETEGEELDD
jgi:segregation and condensation protein B